MTLTFRDVHEFTFVIQDQHLSLDELDKIWWYLEHTRFSRQVEPDPNLREALKNIFSQIDSLSLSSDDIKFCQHFIEEVYRSHPNFVPEDDSRKFLEFQQSMLQKRPSNNQKKSKKKSAKKNFWNL